jgi:hypothetical protein
LVDPELVGTFGSDADEPDAAVVPCAWLNASAKLEEPDVSVVAELGPVPSVPPAALPPIAPNIPWISWIRASIPAIPSIEI